MSETTDDKVMAAVLEALPGKHLEIWGKVRERVPGVHPAEVWRCMANTVALTHNKETGVWSRKP